MRKSRILSFLFGLIPGAGQMYLGYMKRGVSLMSVFWLIVCLAGFLNLGFLLFLLPVIWFYAFFDTLNLRSTHYEFLPNDEFLFHMDTVLGNQLVEFFRRRHLLSGILLIVLGVYILLHSFVLPVLLYTFNLNIYPLFDNLPTLLVAFVIIFLGIRLIKNSVPPKALEDDYQPYTPSEDEDPSAQA